MSVAISDLSVKIKADSSQLTTGLKAATSNVVAFKQEAEKQAFSVNSIASQAKFLRGQEKGLSRLFGAAGFSFNIQDLILAPIKAAQQAIADAFSGESLNKIRRFRAEIDLVSRGFTTQSETLTELKKKLDELTKPADKPDLMGKVSQGLGFLFRPQTTLDLRNAETGLRNAQIQANLREQDRRLAAGNAERAGLDAGLSGGLITDAQHRLGVAGIHQRIENPAAGADLANRLLADSAKATEHLILGEQQALRIELERLHTSSQMIRQLQDEANIRQQITADYEAFKSISDRNQTEQDKFIDNMQTTLDLLNRGQISEELAGADIARMTREASSHLGLLEHHLPGALERGSVEAASAINQAQANAANVGQSQLEVLRAVLETLRKQAEAGGRNNQELLRAAQDIARQLGGTFNPYSAAQ